MIHFTNVMSPLVSLLVSSLFLFAINGYIFSFVRRKIFALSYIFMSILMLTHAYFFETNYLTYVLFITYLIMLIIFVMVNTTELKANINTFFSTKKQMSTIVNYDKDMIYDILFDTVSHLSKNRIGGIVTLERKTHLQEVIQNGKMLNAPISSDLISSIFYPGTLLHDGAIIIRGSMIVAASVYFTPTTRPLAGHYGSRHRAALGISETTDAVTIVISEQTGRISLTYGGKITGVYLDNFKQVLANFMENKTV